MPPDEEVHAIASNESPHPEVLLQPELREIVQRPFEPAPLPRGVAPLWHTLVLVLGILAFSIWGAVSGNSGSANPFAPVHSGASAASNGSDHVRLIRYGLTAALELLAVAWVALGLRLRKVPFRSLFGAWPSGLNNITKEAGIAAAFWICSMTILVFVAFSWSFVQTQIYKHQMASQSSSPSASQSKSGKQESPERQQAEMARKLIELAPANDIEIASWGLLCLIVGFSEELIFRGYLQSQTIDLLRTVPISVLLTSVVFGAAHGYQGLRGICLIGLYGALFSSLTLLRRNLFPGMLAHSWHDFATGMLLAFIRSTHLLDRLPSSH